MLSKSKNLTIPYALIQFFFWFVYGAAVNFASVYLLSSGLNNTVIGLISAAACALSVLLQPLLASYADRPHSPSVKALLAGMTAVLLIFGLSLPAVLDRYQEDIANNLLSEYQYMLTIPLDAVDEEHKLKSAIAMLRFTDAVNTENPDAEKAHLDE